MAAGDLYTPSGYHRSWRAQIAAKYGNFHLRVVDYIPGRTDEDAEFQLRFPKSAVPVFRGEDGTCLFDANAIAFLVGNEQLRGGSQQHLVTQWVNFADNTLLPPVATWVYPCLNVTQFNKANTEKAKIQLNSILDFMNNHLSSVTYLIGNVLTQADITVFTALQPLFANVYTEEYRKPFPHVVRWYTTIGNQPHVLEVVGSCELCVTEARADPKKFTAQQQQTPKSKKTEPKATKQSKAESKTSQPEKAPVELPKERKNPLAELPGGDYDMDAFKRVYSNEDIETVAIPYFWDHFDPEKLSIWYCEYLYPEDLGMIFMTSNLINGMFQRAEKMNKYAFGSMCIFGDNSKNSIRGLWFWRGTGLIFEVSEDLQVDYDSYSWRKLDPKEEETKSLVRAYFTQKFEDNTFTEGHVYK